MKLKTTTKRMELTLKLGRGMMVKIQRMMAEEAALDHTIPTDQMIIQKEETIEEADHGVQEAIRKISALLLKALKFM